MRRFREVVSYCCLTDLGYADTPFTWCNGRSGEGNIKERLGRSLATNAWKQNRPYFSVKHLPRFKSDHNPILINDAEISLGKQRQGGNRGFRFEHMWLQHSDFHNVLKESWVDTHMVDSLDEKLQRCGEGLSR